MKQAKADAQELIDAYHAEKQEEFNNMVLSKGGSVGEGGANCAGRDARTQGAPVLGGGTAREQEEQGREALAARVATSPLEALSGVPEALACV